MQNYFIPSTYRAGTREYKCYEVTKMGCELLGNKQQGEKGILFTVECKELQALVRKKGVEVLGGKGSQAYIDNSLRGKVYADIQHQLKREFQVTKYEAIKRGQFVTAKEIVKNYRVPTGLKEEVIKVNNQINFEEVI